MGVGEGLLAPAARWDFGPGTHHPWTYPGCACVIPNRGLRARAGTAGPGHFTRRKKKGESPGIGPFAELATPTFFAGPTFFFELSFWPGKAVRDGQGLLAVHAEVKRKVWGSLSGGLGAFWGAQEQKKFNIARFARE